MPPQKRNSINNNNNNNCEPPRSRRRSSRISSIETLAKSIVENERVVFITGAGLSVASGVRPFRGNSGVWTQFIWTTATRDSLRKDPLKWYNEFWLSCMADTTSKDVRPNQGHGALSELLALYPNMKCITQNVDGLHRRAGLSRSYHSSLHGCVFTEKCHRCETEYFGDEDVGGMSFQPTGRSCSVDGCGGNLHDTLLDWEDALPEKDFERAENEARRADLLLCLGTSLRIEPVGSLPLLAKRFVIVNLQVTPKDENADMIIRAPVDDVMDDLLTRIGFDGWKTEPPALIERQWTPPPPSRPSQM